MMSTNCIRTQCNNFRVNASIKSCSDLRDSHHKKIRLIFSCSVPPSVRSPIDNMDFIHDCSTSHSHSMSRIVSYLFKKKMSSHICLYLLIWTCYRIEFFRKWNVLISHNMLLYNFDLISISCSAAIYFHIDSSVAYFFKKLVIRIYIGWPRRVITSSAGRSMMIVHFYRFFRVCKRQIHSKLYIGDTWVLIMNIFRRIRGIMNYRIFPLFYESSYLQNLPIKQKSSLSVFL